MHNKSYSRITLLLLLLPLLVLCTACNGIPGFGLGGDAGPEPESNNIKTDTTVFSKDYKTISVKLRMPDGLADCQLSDSARVRIEAIEESPTYINGGSNMQPRLVKVTDIRREELADHRLSLLLLVDLTLSDDEIAEERRAVQQMRRWFSSSNLHIAFMREDGVTETFLATDYVMQTYFRKSGSKKLLYRSVAAKMDELLTWQSLSREQKGLIVFSDGDVYANDVPVDPRHFELQHRLLQASTHAGYSSVYYVNFGSGDATDNEAVTVMQRLCQATGGEYQRRFKWKPLLTDILSTFNVDYADYRLDFENPDNKVYTGKPMHLHISVYDNGRMVGTACSVYRIGNIYSPVIINGLSDAQVILIGIMTILVLLVIVYLVLQIIVPYISYRVFVHRYVTHYTGAAMIYNGIQVDRSCYYCKAPFEEGDEIVAKCEHVMHRSCWEENGYKCPEHGRKCPDGAHYYNASQPLDRRNAPFFAQWVLLAIVAALLGWTTFVMSSDRSSTSILYGIMLSIHGLQSGTPEAQMAFDHYAAHLKYLPIFGLCQNFFLALALGYMSMQGHPLGMRLKRALTKSVCSGILGYLIFLLTCIVSITLNLSEDAFMVDWIPWALNGLVVAFVSTFGTRIHLRKKWLGVSVLIGLAVMYAWMYIVFYDKMDCREQLLSCFVVYSVALTVCVAVAAPHSERYFLRAEGAMKPVDIALYKWLRTSPDYRVTIGKSVDCSLQMTWDFASTIAPIQATVYNENGKIYMQSVEDGVTVDGQPLSPDDRIRLYHGRSFTIGKTTFTFEEKDVN